MHTFYTYIFTDIGKFFLLSDGEALTGFYAEKQKHFPLFNENWQQNDSLTIFKETTKQFKQYLSGTRQVFELPLALINGTPFQRKVWQAIAKIPFGKTRTYGEIAEKIKSPKSMRAVGSATGKNPISIIIPCHRVIGSNGQLTGYAGGLERKKALLALENDDFQN